MTNQVYDGDVVIVVNSKEEKQWGWLVKKYNVKTQRLGDKIVNVCFFVCFCFDFGLIAVCVQPQDTTWKKDFNVKKVPFLGKNLFFATNEKKRLVMPCTARFVHLTIGALPPTFVTSFFKQILLGSFLKALTWH